MGLDVYAGSLTRYYAGDWETVIQQQARERGMESMVVRPSGSGDDEEEPEPEGIRALVAQWREMMNDVLSEPLEGGELDWDESEGAPYFTDKPDWEGYAGLLLHAAYDESPDRERPSELPGDYNEDPALRESRENLTSSRYSVILGPELWLPGGFGFFFEFKELRGEDVLIGPGALLLHQLRDLNDRTFGAGEADLARWRTGQVETETNLDAHARYGLSIFLDLAESAHEHRLPMKLDY